MPFADCLNHTNVQTKYDFNVDDNGGFRLFPTGRNRYGKGEEVFNSYGRRNNRHLLLEYGFAIENNQWESVGVTVSLLRDKCSVPERSSHHHTSRHCLSCQMSLDSEAPAFPEIREIMHRYLFSSHKTYSVKFHQLSTEVIAFCRLASLNASEIAQVEDHARFYTEPINWRNERAAIALAIQHFQRHIAAFRTPLEEDESVRTSNALAWGWWRLTSVCWRVAALTARRESHPASEACGGLVVPHHQEANLLPTDRHVARSVGRD